VVSFDHPRYEKIERRVTATPGTPVSLDERLSRPAGKLSLVSTPPGASFTVGGKSVGRGPTGTDVSAFTQVTVTAALAGYKPWTQKVYIKGRSYSVHAKLEKLPQPKRPTAPRRTTR
jgi:hypothetical protein